MKKDIKLSEAALKEIEKKRNYAKKVLGYNIVDGFVPDKSDEKLICLYFLRNTGEQTIEEFYQFIYPNKICFNGFDFVGEPKPTFEEAFNSFKETKDKHINFFQNYRETSIDAKWMLFDEQPKWKDFNTYRNEKVKGEK